MFIHSEKDDNTFAAVSCVDDNRFNIRRGNAIKDLKLFIAVLISVRCGRIVEHCSSVDRDSCTCTRTADSIACHPNHCPCYCSTFNWVQMSTSPLMGMFGRILFYVNGICDTR